MSDITGSGSLQFWQGIAAVVGASLGGFFLAIGRKSGGVASRASEASSTGDALQRDILEAVKATTAELRGLRTDWEAKRQADEDRRRDLRERSMDERLDEIYRYLNVNRVGQNDIKHVLGHIIDRLPPSGPRLPAPDDRGPAADQG